MFWKEGPILAPMKSKRNTVPLVVVDLDREELGKMDVLERGPYFSPNEVKKEHCSTSSRRLREESEIITNVVLTNHRM